MLDHAFTVRAWMCRQRSSLAPGQQIENRRSREVRDQAPVGAELSCLVTLVLWVGRSGRPTEACRFDANLRLVGSRRPANTPALLGKARSIGLPGSVQPRTVTRCLRTLCLTADCDKGASGGRRLSLCNVSFITIIFNNNSDRHVRAYPHLPRYIA